MLMNMKDLLEVANRNYFAVPAFNVSDYSMFMGIMESCERTGSPVIIEIHPLELDFTGTDFTEAIVKRAYKSPVPVCLHLDHCGDFGKFICAIQAGFTSVMFDGSGLPFEENMAGAKKIVEIAHPANVSVEAELGTIGSADDQAETGAEQIIYTNPEDAVKFVQETGVDTLAVAIGTSHGLYPGGMTPKLRLDILKDIKAKVSIPLVLHGGSNNSDEEIKESVKLGINKINISSDIKAAYYDKMREVLEDRSLREPNIIQPFCMEAMQKVVEHKLELFRTMGKAALYK
ncbi:MAG: ketose-bisphosphate aldolase [Eubacteriales bacterium]|nr:ketose-bisphosphate aldolase [Eubacteriales bacterium]